MEGGGAAGRVLVVEDEEATRLAYRLILEQAGWQVDEAASGDEGLRVALATGPHVVLIDIAIPGIDGWETMRRLRSAEATRQVALLAVTGHALDEDRSRAAAVGCDGYLVKPVEADRLVAEVGRLARGGR
jgi:CheY-like chemotaxis protein